LITQIHLSHRPPPLHGEIPQSSLVTNKSEQYPISRLIRLLCQAPDFTHALTPNDTSRQSARQSAANRRVCFTPADILRLDEQAQRQRRNDLYPNPHGFSRASQLLRALGDYLDQSRASTFQISWTHDSVSVVFESVDTQSDSRTFSTEKLQELGSHLRFRRSSRPRFDSNSPDSLKQIKPRNR